MSLTEPCLANSAASILAGRANETAFRGGSPEKFSRQLVAMRTFRDKTLRKYDGLGDWWQLAARNTPQAAYLLMTDPKLRKSAGVLFKGVEGALANLDAPLPADMIVHAQRVVALARKSNLRGLRLDASRADAVLQQLKPGATGNDALKLFAEYSPSRYQRED